MFKQLILDATHTFSRSHFSIDFHQNFHRGKNLQSKNEFVWVIIHHTFSYFAPKAVLGQEVLKIHANVN